ncbi:hypothetical protein L596_024844 [Steinernema carpocapsae]|uniref:Rho-GAP domain-containing protein n=2 Tax=Steinernema carpocapsae TaxID=34508 RepID=A0A4U5M648_STECR|nr:hypothetical protein L596_024844 [Steinernema carpocapsae]
MVSEMGERPVPRPRLSKMTLAAAPPPPVPRRTPPVGYIENSDYMTLEDFRECSSSSGSSAPSQPRTSTCTTISWTPSSFADPINELFPSPTPMLSPIPRQISQSPVLSHPIPNYQPPKPPRQPPPRPSPPADYRELQFRRKSQLEEENHLKPVEEEVQAKKEPPPRPPPPRQLPFAPPIDKSDGQSICFSGWVELGISSVAGKKEKELKDSHKKRCWAVMRCNQLSFLDDDETETPSLGPYDLNLMHYVGKCSRDSSTISLILKDISSPNTYTVLRVTPEEMLPQWLLLLAKCIAPENESLAYSMPEDGFNVGGRVFLRQGATGSWTGGWAHISKRSMFYMVSTFDNLFEVDMRKILSLKKDLHSTDWCPLIENSLKGPFLLTKDGSSLYMQAESDSSTSQWFDWISGEMTRYSNLLEDNRLTPDDVPIIVDKCIKFVSTYGLFQKGIYRRNGLTSDARQLIDDLRRDPFNVHITHTSEETVNTVADVLRSFFRQLEKPLILPDIHEDLFAISVAISEANVELPQKLLAYQVTLRHLPDVHYATLRKLLDHLKDVTGHCNVNLATIENIAKIFGPTLFRVDKDDEMVTVDNYNKAVKQATVIRDLILNYAEVFGVTDRELIAKSQMDRIQEQEQLATGAAGKARADGFLVAIHLFAKDNQAFNVQSDWSASEVCRFAMTKRKFDVPQDTFALFEKIPGVIPFQASEFLPSILSFPVVKNGQLKRRVNSSEVLNSMVVGRWMDWDPKDCFFLFVKDACPFRKQDFRSFAEEVKLAEPGSKSFKTASFKLENGQNVVHYSKSMKPTSSWVIDETLWFLGHERAKTAVSPHAHLLPDK